MREIDFTKLDNEDKGIFPNLRKYDEELEMLEDWLINPRVDKHDCLMFDDNIRKEQTTDKSTKLFYNLVDSNRESRGQQQFQEKKMQVYHPKDRLDMEIEELRLLMVKMSQRRNEERMNIFISRTKKQSSRIR